MLLPQLVNAVNYGQGPYGCGLYGIGCGPAVVPAPGAGGASPGAVAERTAAMTQSLCTLSSGLAWYNETCYECNGFIMERDEEILCTQCPEGFIFEDGKCKATIEQKTSIPLYIIFAITILVVIEFLTKRTRKQEKRQVKKIKEKFKKEEIKEEKNE